MTLRSSALIAAGAVVVLLFVALLFLSRPAGPVSTSPAATITPSPATPTPTATPTTTAPRSPTAIPGAITGRLGFPSEFIPPLTVYAISVADTRVFFSVQTPRYPLATNTPPQPTYTITSVAPGTYYVLAYRDDNQPGPDRPGVYSQYVLCGGGQTCTDHSLAPVAVRSGETTTGIDVIDWYYPPTQTYPPRPR